LRAAVVDGGLISHGVDLIELFRQAGLYADRILSGEKPGDLTHSGRVGRRRLCPPL